MTRLCAFVEQITLPRPIRSRLPFGAAQGPEPVEGEAAPTMLFLAEPTARREGPPYPRSQQVVHPHCRVAGWKLQDEKNRKGIPFVLNEMPSIPVSLWFTAS